MWKIKKGKVKVGGHMSNIIVKQHPAHLLYILEHFLFVFFQEIKNRKLDLRNKINGITNVQHRATLYLKKMRTSVPKPRRILNLIFKIVIYTPKFWTEVSCCCSRAHSFTCGRSDEENIGEGSFAILLSKANKSVKINFG